MQLFQIRTRPDLQSEWTDHHQVLAENTQEAMQLAKVPDFTLLTAVEVRSPGFFLNIELGNAAMLETADVIAELHAVADRLEQFGPTTEGACTDTNGNTVGSYALVLPEPPVERVLAREIKEGDRVKIGDTFERVEIDAAPMPGGQVEIITEPYSEGFLMPGDKGLDLLTEEEV